MIDGLAPDVDELRPTRRDALNHLFGIPPTADHQEPGIRKTPPFTLTKVDDGIAYRGTVGVVFESSRPPAWLDRSRIQDRVLPFSSYAA